jgi:HlyD family secretion protein
LRIAGTIIIAALLRTARRGSPVSAAFACCAAARSTVPRNICVRRPASGMIPTYDIRRMDFVSFVSCSDAVESRHGPDIRASSMKFSGLARATLVGGIILLASLPATLFAAETSSPSTVQVSVVRATKACFSSTIRVTGFLVARDEAIVTLDAPGLRVTEVLVGEGDRVTSGQTLVRLVRQAGEGQDAAAAARTSIILKAPAAGVVTRSTAVVGATASPMQTEPLFRIAVDNEIELEAEVPSIHAGAISPGQTARIQIEDSRELSGRVRQAPAAVDQRTQLGRARLSLERDPWLRLGMFARATIDADRSCGISVPRSAVHYRTEGPRVQVVRDNVIETRVVQVGFHSDMDIEIREGLREGDLIVANAGSSLRDGDKVNPIMADTLQLGQR